VSTPASWVALQSLVRAFSIASRISIEGLIDHAMRLLIEEARSVTRFLKNSPNPAGLGSVAIDEDRLSAVWKFFPEGIALK
jgi:hypothetical protein